MNEINNFKSFSFQVRVYSSEEHPMREGYFFSDEPGYYEPNVGGKAI